MGRAACATLVTEHLIHNWHTLKRRAPHSRMWAMVKANAYGHGIRSVSLRLAPHLSPQDALGVASVDEGLALREAGVSSSIVLIEGVFEPDELDLAAKHNFTIIFHSKRQVNWLLQRQLTSRIQAWVKVNTGMGRLGFSTSEAIDAWKQVSSSPFVDGPVGVMSHLACADEKDNPLNETQFKEFETFHSLGAPLGLCNSAGLLHWPDRHYDVVRPGLALYGISPTESTESDDWGLKPVLSLHTNIIARHFLNKGDGVGYGSSFVCPEDMPIGIAAMGYGDGYPRLAQGSPVMIQGVTCPVVGRVSMDMMAIDLRQCLKAKKNVEEGDSVLLWGMNHLGYLPVEEVARTTGRSPYDLVTGVQHRVKFNWV